MKTIFLILILLFFCNPKENISNYQLEPKILDVAKNRTVFIVSPSIDRPNGTGFFLNNKGLILTCYHVTSGIDDSIEILLSDLKTKIKGKTLIKEPLFDLQIIKIEHDINLPKIELSDVDIIIGSKVFMFGSPYGLVQTYSEGYISGKNRTKASLQFSEIPFIQTQGLSYPGNSGGAVYNFGGKIIGINQATYGFSSGTGIGLTIPSAYIKAFLDTNQIEY